MRDAEAVASLATLFFFCFFSDPWSPLCFLFLSLTSAILQFCSVTEVFPDRNCCREQIGMEYKTVRGLFRTFNAGLDRLPVPMQQGSPLFHIDIIVMRLSHSFD